MNDSLKNNKRIARNTLYLYLRSIFLLIISLYTSRETLRILGVEDFGIYQVVGGVVAMFSMLSSTLASATQRFITFAIGEGNNEKLKNVFSSCIMLHLWLGVIIVVLLEILGIWFLKTQLNIPEYRLNIACWVLHLSIITFFINIISLPYNAIIIAHEKMGVFAYMSILEGILKLAAVLLLSTTTWDKLLIYAVLQLLIALLLRCIYSLYTRNAFSEVKNLSYKIENKLFKEMFAFAGWNLFGEGSLVLRNQGVDIILNIFLGVVVNAAKGISNQVQSAIQQLVGNFTTALKPQLTKAIAQKDYKRTFSLINNGSRYSFILMLILAVPTIISAPSLLELWLTEVPLYAVAFVRWTMFYLLIYSLSRMLIHAILSEGHIKKFQIIDGGTKLLAIPLTYSIMLFRLEPLLGIWINIFLEVICLIIRLTYNKKLLHFNHIFFIKNVIGRCCLLFIVSITFSHLITSELRTGFIPTIFLTFLITIVAIWTIGMNSKEHLMVINYINKRVLKRF